MKRIRIKQINLLLVSVAFCVAPTMVSAQQSTVEYLLRQCAKIDHDRQRLSCYDQVLRPRKVDTPDEGPTATEVWEATKPEATIKSPPAYIPSESPPTTPLPKEELVDGDNFGLDRRRGNNATARSVTIKEIGRNRDGKTLFRTEDDHVWVRTDTRNIAYGTLPFEAVISVGRMGSFYMKLMSSGIAVKVRRLK